MKSKTAIGAIRSITLPENFSITEDTVGKVALSHLRRYECDINSNVEISFFYRGTELSEPDTKTLRHYLSQPNQILLRASDSGEISEEDIAKMQEFYFIIGTPGNNQISNPEKGMRGPRFFLQKIETITISGKRCLAVTGWFHGPGGNIQNFFYGTYFDAKRTSELCRLEEVYLHTPTENLFEKYLIDFKETLKTIIWK